ncbi:MAG TPA: hypothetical protein VM821_01135, partial [Abditibacteriaceae bacterium]|nr:hypothetical protein [Abditibacteriaceae bacterium]
VIFLLALASFAFYRWHYGPTIFLGSQTVDVLQNSDRVEVLKIIADDYGIDRKESGNTQNVVGGHPITDVGKTLDKNSTSRLGETLTERGMYFPFGGFDPFGCGLAPGLAFRFTKGAATVNVLACYQCQHLIFLTRDENRKVSSYVTPYAVNKLKPFFQQGFPQDKKLFDREIDSDN